MSCVFKCIVSHYGLVTPYYDSIEVGLYWFRYKFDAWRHQATAWTIFTYR